MKGICFGALAWTCRIQSSVEASTSTSHLPCSVRVLTMSRAQWPNNISVSSAPTIRGPWSPFEILINGTNPAPASLWSLQNPTPETALVAEDLKIFTAPNYSGAYTQISTAPWNTSDYSPTWTEDPFVWRDKRGHWHALAHWMIDITESNQKYPRVGAHMFAHNLAGPWTFRLQEAFNSTVTFTDGSVETFNRRERPKLFFSDDGEFKPLYMVNGVQRMGTTTESFTLIQPVGTAWREYERKLGF